MQEQKNRSGQRLQVNSYLELNREREEKRDQRLATGLMAALSVLVPPAGLLAVWRSRHLSAPLRIGLSLAALLSMTLIFWLWLRGGKADVGILPVPVVPAYAGYDTAAIETTPEPVQVYNAIPESGSVFTVTYGDGTVDDLTGGSALPVDPASYVTIVYAVTNNATKYHNLQVCDMQTNSRILTLDEAIAEGLQPCEKCVLSANAAG
ncbi:MAG: hypothetical protein IKS52_10460 [Clostridia bacterium]|nr:hypothetical protein [Clostridia bacterium]MBR4443675.1 hypothetical protein [Clostridia bacterium]